jgi:uncharacterized domain HDIG
MVRRRVKRESFLKIYDELGIPEHVKRHCIAVGDAAVNICAALTEAGIQGLDADAVCIAGYLHDIARTGKDHDIVGAQMLKKMSFAEYGISDETHMLAASIIEHHMRHDLPSNIDDIDSLAIVMLADRITKEDVHVGYRTRMEDLLRRYKDLPEVVDRVHKNMERVLCLIDQIEEKVDGRSLKDIATGGRVDITPILRLAERPGRYIGGEIGNIRKEWYSYFEIG